MANKSSPVNTQHQQQRMLKALEAHYGNVSKATKAVGITRQTHYNWYKENEEYCEKVDLLKVQCHEEFKDLIMEAVIKKIKEGNTQIIALCFKTVCAEDAEQLQKLNPYKPKLKMRIRVMPNPNPNYAKDPFTQQAIREYEETLQRQREGRTTGS